MNQKQRMERGITLIEMAIALMLVAVVVAGITSWMSGINQQLQLRGDAKHFSSVAKAAQLYLKGERGELIKDYDAGTRTKLVTMKDLQDAGYLATEIHSTLGRKQQNITMLIKMSKPAHNVEIRSLLITSGGISSTPDYTNDELGTMVNMAGTSAGFMVKDGDPIQGISGSWEVKAADWSFGPAIKPGHLVALLTDTLTSGLNNKVVSPYQLEDFSFERPMKNETGKYIQINMLINCPYKDFDKGDWGRITFWVVNNKNQKILVAMAGKHYGAGSQKSISFIVPPGHTWSGDTNYKSGGGSVGCYPVEPSGNFDKFDKKRGHYVVTELD